MIEYRDELWRCLRGEQGARKISKTGEGNVCSTGVSRLVRSGADKYGSGGRAASGLLSPFLLNSDFNIDWGRTSEDTVGHDVCGRYGFSENIISKE